MDYGKLFLIPTTLGENEPLEVLPLSIKRAIEEIDYYIAENEKNARRFIKKVSSKKPQAELNFQLLNKFTEQSEIQSYIDPCFEGHNIGLLSDAGCPGIADPGADIVTLAHSKSIQVVPLVGPSSITMAMMSSGLNGQNFAFNGYLPIDKSERKAAIKRFEKVSVDLNQSQIFIETPYRNDQLFKDFILHLKAHTRLCIACDITLSTEYIHTKTVHEWKHEKQLEILHKRPAIFIFHQA